MRTCIGRVGKGVYERSVQPGEEGHMSANSGRG